MSVKMSIKGTALEYFNIKINNGFTVEDLAYLILGWENNIDKIKKIKSYSKLMTIAKKQLLDKGLMFLDTAWENLDYIDNLDNVHKQVIEHIKDVEPTKYLGKTRDEIKQIKLEKQFIDNMNVINGIK
jgi:3'-phosphoadenosine 5'-phosphosulfate sulfotransferase (PAPS reductase)/FAD synthetase